MDKRARTPSMDGFRWFTTAPAPRRAGNGWCVRDALCELYGWAPGSKNWRTFVVEYPEGKDIERLVQHLGLVWLDRQKVGEDSTLQDHPGVAFYDLDLYQVSHCVFEPHVRFLRPLSPLLRAARPHLRAVAVDVTLAHRS